MWRVPYAEDEKQELKVLIDACKKEGVTFFYGISPGLDMTYSSKRDMTELKAKLDQARRTNLRQGGGWN